MTGAWRRWLQSLFGAAINGAANAATVALVDPDDFNPFAGGEWTRLVAVTAVSAIAGAALFLRRHPLPWDGHDRRRRQKRAVQP